MTLIKTTLDRYYFHISNSGISAETIETSNIHTIDGDTKIEITSYDFNHNLHAFGIGSDTTLPLRTVEQVDVYISMLQNVRQKMLDRYGPEGRDKHEAMAFSRPTVVNTFKAEEVYGPVEGDDKNGGKDLLGYNLVDDDGTVKGFVKNTVEGRGRYWGSASCTDDSSDEAEIKVVEKRQSLRVAVFDFIRHLVGLPARKEDDRYPPND